MPMTGPVCEFLGALLSTTFAKTRMLSKRSTGLSAEQRHRLDTLTQRRAETNQSRLA